MRSPIASVVRVLSCAAVVVMAIVATKAQTVPLPATEQQRMLLRTFGGSDNAVVDPQNPQTIYWAVRDLGVLRSFDGGVTWAPMNDGLSDLMTMSLAMDPQNASHLDRQA